MGVVCFLIEAIGHDGEVITKSLWNSEEAHSSEDCFHDDIELVIGTMRDTYKGIVRIVVDISFL